MIKIIPFLLVALLSSHSVAEPDEYTRFLMNRKVDWFSMGMILTKMELDQLSKDLRGDGKTSALDLDYDGDKDAFIINELWPEADCEYILKELRTFFNITEAGKIEEPLFLKFGRNFHPPFFDNLSFLKPISDAYEKWPDKLDRNLSEKVVFTCNDEVYSLIN